MNTRPEQRAQMMRLFSGTGNPKLSQAIADKLNLPLGKLKINRFADLETYVAFDESVRGTDAFILQPTCPPVDTNLVELLILIDALRRASADRITAVIPYYGYARQEKKDRPREPITAKLIADIITTSGADRVIALDLHADAIQGFFNIPVDHLTSLSIFAEYIRKQNLENMIIVSPDEGRVKQARKLVRMVEAPLAVGYKHHPEKMVTEITDIAGDVRGKTPVIIEDMITTGGSIIECVNALVANGANPQVHVCATHGVLAGEAVDRLQNHEAIASVVVTDSIPLAEEKMRPKIKQLSIAPLLAEAIRRVNQDLSVTSLFD